MLKETPPFLSGGGEMGSLIRAHGWSFTPLGVPETWPQSLRTVVRLMLNTRHPMYIFWGEAGYCFYNDAYRQIIGPDRHPGSLGRPAREVWDEIWPVIGPQFAQVMAGQGATWHENQLIPITRGDQRVDVYWTYSYSPIDDETASGGVGGVLVVCTDTTPQVGLSAQLAKSQERLQLALSAGRGIGTWDWDVQADRVVADERFARLYGVDAAWARAGAPIAEFFAHMHPDDVDRIRSRVAYALRTGELFSEEYRLVDPGGEVSWVLAEGRCELSAEGAPLRFPGVSFDITDRKAIEQRLRDLNTDLERQVVERALERGRTWQVSPELLGVLNGAGHFETSNPAWQTVLGWSEEEIAAKVFFEFIHLEDLPKTQAAWADATQRGLPALRLENRFQTKSGDYRWLSWVAVPEGGKVYCSARDVTDDKARADALVSAETALRQSQKMEAVGQLTGGLAHDFNNLLAAISGSLELLGRRVGEGRTADLQRYVEAGRAACRRAAALTHRLLAFSRRQTLEPKVLDVNRLVGDMEDLVRRTLGPAIALAVDRGEGLWGVKTDPSQLENAVLNLCINARDAMPDGGKLTIETANLWVDERMAGEGGFDSGEYVSVCVGDDGVGMSAEVAARAFDPFYTTKPLGMGTGLGLSMIYGFAKQSGGHARIHTELGKGTRVFVYLPRHLGREEGGEAEMEREAPLARTEAGKTVMIVDDEPALRAVMAEVMQDNGYATLEAGDGMEALRMFGDGRYRVDLLVTDVGMPGINGRQLADAARVTQPDLKVLFVTGYAENAALSDGHLGPGMGVVTKPFEIDSLVRRARELLDG